MAVLGVHHVSSYSGAFTIPLRLLFAKKCDLRTGVDRTNAFTYHPIMSLDRQVFRIALPIAVAYILFFAVAAQVVRAGASESFSLLLTAPGVAVYGDETEEGSEEYVQILDLSAGARIVFWHGPMVDAGRGKGQYGGSSPQIERHLLPDVWGLLQSREPYMLCLANGQFFRDTVNGLWVNPTELAFPLKSDGVVVSEGYEQRRFRQQRGMLEVWDDRATISAFSRRAFYASTAPNVIVGLEEQARVRATESLGRTFVGIGDGDGDGVHERLLIYSGAAATQSRAASVLRDFGAREIMILDGGGSSQLSCEGVNYIRRIRPLPQMIATVPAVVEQTPPDLYLSLFEKTLARWLALLSGDQ